MIPTKLTRYVAKPIVQKVEHPPTFATFERYDHWIERWYIKETDAHLLSDDTDPLELNGEWIKE